MRSIREIKKIKGKTVLVRVDFNVPIKDGKVLDAFRIKKALPTIKFLEKKGAKIILITHLGRNGSESLEPVIKLFFKFSKCSRTQVSFFENIRKFDGEATNSSSFTKDLVKLGDFYVNEAFSVSHRAHASIVGLPKLLPSYAGFQLEEEIKNLSKVFKSPKHPFLFILGGAKFETKLPIIKKYLKIADHLFIGGAILNDFLKARGYEIGVSLVSDKNYGIEKICKNKKIILPEYVIVKNENGKYKEKNIKDVLETDNILDVGSKEIEKIKPYIKNAKLIVWNGPLGKYEAGGAKTTKQILKLVAQSKAESIIGGGDTVDLISEMKMINKFSFISTGGGATLDFLANGTLPGIKALQ
ncbi:MAG: phosphoglycerate kinase [Candidatus Paceibacterota bacterium]|jgi:phosphoglycerate kinase